MGARGLLLVLAVEALLQWALWQIRDEDPDLWFIAAVYTLGFVPFALVLFSGTVVIEDKEVPDAQS